jgi:hypothetical protein
MASRVAQVAACILKVDSGSAPSAFEATEAMLQGAAWAVSQEFSPNGLADALAGALR